MFEVYPAIAGLSLHSTTEGNGQKPAVIARGAPQLI